jgi:hypothetical protein
MPSSGTRVRRTMKASVHPANNRIRHLYLIWMCEAFAPNACVTCPCRHGREKSSAYTALPERVEPASVVLCTAWKKWLAERSVWRGRLIGRPVQQTPSVKVWVT